MWLWVVVVTGGQGETSGFLREGRCWGRVMEVGNVGSIIFLSIYGSRDLFASTCVLGGKAREGERGCWGGVVGGGSLGSWLGV